MTLKIKAQHQTCDSSSDLCTSPSLSSSFPQDGRPIYIEQLGKLDLNKLYAVTTPERQIQHLVHEYERFEKDRLPACTKAKGELVETSCTIMDLKDVGLSQFYKVKEYVGQASGIGQNNCEWLVLNDDFALDAL